MEQKTIPLNKGIVRNTSLATDGELIDCVNLMPKNGQMMNAPVLTEALTETGETLTLGNMETLLYIHPTSVGNVYVVKYSSEGAIIIAYKKEGSNVEICTLPPNAEVYEVKHIGNVLVVLTSKRTAMFLYEDGEYVDYTFDFDSINIEFALRGDVVLHDSKSIKAVGARHYGADNFILLKTWSVNNSSLNIYPYDLGYKNVFKEGEVFKLDLIFTGNKFSKHRWSSYMHKTDGSSTSIAEYQRLDTTPSFTMETNVDAIQVTFTEDIGYITVRLLKTNKTGVIIDKSESDNLFGLVNSAIAESLDSNKFIFPFFVRAGLELADGTIINTSPPCLMVPTTGVTPYIETISDINLNSDYTTQSHNFSSYTIDCDLLYKVDSDFVDYIKRRKAIIKNLVIAVTPPIYRYKQGVTDYEQVCNLAYINVKDDDRIFCIPSIRTYADDGTPEEKTKKELWESKKYESKICVLLPENSLKDEIEKASVFRIVKRYGIEEINTSDDFIKVDLDNGCLKGLDGRTILPDAPQKTDSIGRTSFAFNDRLSIANIREIIKKPMINCNGLYVPKDKPYVSSIRIKGKYEYELIGYNYSAKITYGGFMWLYLPGNINNCEMAFECLDEYSNPTYYKRNIEFNKHPYLDGVYWFDDFSKLSIDGERITFNEFETYVDAEESFIDSPNKIKTSEVNNPFVMKQTTSLNDEVVALATATKALSEGQFGQFPLYAFCKDGIWALEPSSDGTYASKQPVSRDICSNTKAITQTDNAVVYPTMQGLKLLQGSTTTNISNVMDGKTEDTSFLKDIIADYNEICLTDNADFNEAIQDAVIAYDYINSLLHIYTSNASYIYTSNASYIYNLSSGDWTRTDDQKPTAIVPGYPYSTIQMETKLYHYDKPASDGTRKGMLLTRETAFDDPLTMKIIKDLRVMRKHGEAKVAVWVSNDRQNWGRLTSLRMHSYKWYRFAVFTNLNNTDALEGIVAQIESRMTNKMR